MNVMVGTPGVPEHTRSGSRWLGREAIEWTLRPEVIERLGVRSRDRDLLFLRAVASYARWDEAARAWVAWPAVDTLLRDCGWPSKAKAYRALASLADAALVRRTGERRGLGGSNVYELAIPPKPPQEGETTSTEREVSKSSHSGPEVVSQLRDANSEEERAFGSLPLNNRGESRDGGPAEGGPRGHAGKALPAQVVEQVLAVLTERGCDRDEVLEVLGSWASRDPGVVVTAARNLANKIDGGAESPDRVITGLYVAYYYAREMRSLTGEAS